MAPDASPHLRALGVALPWGLQRFHADVGRRTVCGQATVTTGGKFGRALLRLLGLHLRDGKQALDVTFMLDGSGAIWDRQFGTGRFISRIEADGVGFLVETFGPSFMAPRIAAREWLVADKAYAMSVEVAFPLLGLVLRYEGEFHLPQIDEPY